MSPSNPFESSETLSSEPQSNIRSSEPSSQSRASQACMPCRKQKRKCDKALPNCSLCLRMSRACDYSDNSPPPTSDDFATLRQQVQDLEARLSERQTQNRGSSDGSSGGIFSATPPSSHSGRQLTAAMLGISANNWRTSNAFPAIFFLDSEAFDYAHLTVPKPHMLVWAEVLECLGDVSAVQALVSTYFTSIHLWLPIVSKKRLYQILSNALTEPGPDLALLLLCMKLIATPPDDFGMESPQTYCYSMAKRFYSAVEQNGTYSIHLLQAAVLIGLYEVGHAIYPAAYLTVGHCARMGYAMGIHRRKDLPQMLNRPSTWTDVEERGRVWWAVLILDRYVNLGFIGRPLATEDPSRDDYLPVDENKWDEGDMAVNEFLVVSSATSLKASSFARTCQATNLLGRIIRHINDRTLDLPFRFEEALQLNRTVQALSALLASECTTVGSLSLVCTSLAICYSTLVTLYELYSCTEQSQTQRSQDHLEMQGIAISGLKNMASEAAIFAKLVRNAFTYDDGSELMCSVFICNCLYQAAANYAWLVRETSSESCAEILRELRETLRLIDRRWKVAGEYLRILDATDFQFSCIDRC